MVVPGGCVDGVENAVGALQFGVQAGMFGFAGPADLAEEHGVVFGGLGPRRPVAGVVGGLRAARGVAHPDQGLAGAGGAREFQAQCPGGVGEPAVVRQAQVQRSGALAEQVEHPLVAGEHVRRGASVIGEVTVDGGKNSLVPLTPITAVTRYWAAMDIVPPPSEDQVPRLQAFRAEHLRHRDRQPRRLAHGHVVGLPGRQDPRSQIRPAPAARPP